jgi:hypothetical protein
MLEYIKAFGPIAALLVGPWIAMRVYYRQKDYETTKQRYLEGCLDVIAGQLQATLGTVSHNYARCMVLCKAYRDYGAEFDVAEIAKGFRELDNSKFLQTEHFRLRRLIDSDIAWSFYQAALAYAASADATLTKEIPDALRILSKKPEGERDRRKDAERMINDARVLHDRSFVYATLQSELNTLAAVLEREKLGNAEVQSFAARPEVKEAVERLQRAYDTVPADEAGVA